MTIDTAGKWLDLARQHPTALLIGGGLVVGLLLVLARVVRHQRHRSAALTAAAAGIALGFSAEGMWEVAVGALHLAKWQAVLLFAFAEVLMLFEADQARKKIADHRDPARHLRAVWVIALVAGLAAASHADNLSGQIIRAGMPLAVAWQWASRIKDDLPDVVKQESQWIWTPRRIGIHLGLLKPGTVDDLGEVFRARRIAALVGAGVTLYAERQAAKLRGDQPVKLRWWQRDRLAAATAKMQRLAMTATREDVTAARTQLRLTFGIEGALLGQDEQPSESERQLLDDVRRIMTQATTRLRDEHRRAFGPARPEPMVELGGIRMPAHIAAQIPPMPEPVREPAVESAREPVRPTLGEPAHEPMTGSPRPAPAAQQPAQPRITERVTKPAATDTAKKIGQVHARLTRRLKREPTNPELAEAAGVSVATVKRWKSNRT